MQFSNKIISDYGTLKRYGENIFKVTHIKEYCNPDIEKEHSYTEKGKGGNDSKLDNNLSRTRSTAYEIALCNPWELFVTFTFDKEKIERDNIEKLCKNLSQWIRDYNKKYNCSIKYMLIPEKHKDGINWHMHGFIMNLPETHLQYFDITKKAPQYITEKVRNGEVVYNWESYLNKFGFCVLEPVKNNIAASKYIMKYITKDLQRSVTELNAHMYYSSKGLQKAELICKGLLTKALEEPVYSNDYVAVQYYDTLEESKKYFISDYEESDKQLINEYRKAYLC